MSSIIHQRRNSLIAGAVTVVLFAATLIILTAQQPTPDLTALYELASEPVAENADWTPVEAEFDGVPLVLVPVGCFVMGDDEHHGEDPEHEQCIEAPYWIDKTEVTQEQFRLNNGEKAERDGFAGDERPVETVTWFEADAYCRQRGARLATELEWEFAARGPSNLMFPWGEEFDRELVNFRPKSDDETAEVGSRPSGATWVGALDMAGNVWEWTSSLSTPYPYDALDGREGDTGDDVEVERVMRGGGWYDTPTHFFRGASRDSDTPDYASDDVGFRCAQAFELE